MSNEWTSNLHAYGQNDMTYAANREAVRLAGYGHQGSGNRTAQRQGDQALAAQDSRAQSLRATAARWFEHPSPITQHEREMQYQAYKARLMLELGLSDGRVR